MREATRSPKISILLPARDAEETLAACLESVGRQVERDWECVIVDDGSRDATAKVARAFARRDARFVLARRPRAGLVEALNAGLSFCRGTWVARMDADDLMHRDRLREQLSLLESRPGLDAAGCRVRLFPRDALGPGMREYEAWINALDGPASVRRDAFIECPVAHPALFARRALLERFGYRDRGWPEDYDLMLRLLAAGTEIGVAPRRLLLWRHTAGRLSRTSPVYGPAAFTECKAEHLCHSFLANRDSYDLWGYGATGRTLCAALSRRGRKPSRIVDLHPGRLGNRVHGALVIAPEHLGAGPRERMIVSVAGAGPRARIRSWLTRTGRVELRDFICAA